MAIQFSERTQTPAYILILVVMFNGLIELHGLRVCLPVHDVYARQVNCILRYTSSKN